MTALAQPAIVNGRFTEAWLQGAIVMISEVILEHAKRGGFPANLVAEVTAVFDRTGPRSLPV